MTVGSLHSAGGGPPRTVSKLAEHVARLGVSVELVACDLGPKYGDPILPPPDLVKTHLVPCFNLEKARLRWAPKFKTKLIELCNGKKDVILHDNGVWLQTNHAASSVARQLKIPLLITPRGTLTKWSMGYKAWKKRIAWLLYQKRDLMTARAFHATSNDEADDLRELGFIQPISIIPNGIDMPEWKEKPAGEKEVKTALFLSRLNPTKGLLDLVSAWATLRPNNWKCIIAGPDENGYRAVVEKAVHNAGLENVFTFVGPVDGEAKWDLYRSADLFILPTYSENFGIVIAEAFACGTPVITTKGAPWKIISSINCGWWIDIGVDPLRIALQDVFNVTMINLITKGKLGYKYVNDNFKWEIVSNLMVNVYDLLLKYNANLQ